MRRPVSLHLLLRINNRSVAVEAVLTRCGRSSGRSWPEPQHAVKLFTALRAFDTLSRLYA